MRIFDLFNVLKADTQELVIASVSGVTIFNGTVTDIPQLLFTYKVREVYTGNNKLYIIINEIF